MAFPFLSNCISDLKLELPKYLAKADDDTAPADCVEWWKQHKEELPFQYVILSSSLSQENNASIIVGILE